MPKQSRPGKWAMRALMAATQEKEWAVAGELRLAAVLVPVVQYDSGPSILLTRRADHLDKHSGQVAFPGGKVEERDASPVATALREAEEEIGLDQILLKWRAFSTLIKRTAPMLPVVSFVQPSFT